MFEIPLIRECRCSCTGGVVLQGKWCGMGVVSDSSAPITPANFPGSEMSCLSPNSTMRQSLFTVSRSCKTALFGYFLSWEEAIHMTRDRSQSSTLDQVCPTASTLFYAYSISRFLHIYYSRFKQARKDQKVRQARNALLRASYSDTNITSTPIARLLSSSPLLKVI